MSEVVTDPASTGSTLENVSLRDVESILIGQLKRVNGPGEEPAHRARMSNLIIYCDSADEAVQIRSLIPEIVAIHPARVILLIAERGHDSDQLQVSTHVCRTDRESHRFWEQITLRSSGGAASRLPFAVRELLIGDIPTNLWWTSHTPPALAGPILFELSEYAQQVLYDSIGWVEPHKGIAATDGWLHRFERDGNRHGGWRVASDLNWRRLKTWRRILAEGLSPVTAPGVLAAISEVEIEHGPHSVTQGWAIAGWLASRLGWTYQSGSTVSGEELVLKLGSKSCGVRLKMIRRPEGPPSIRRIRISCSGEGCVEGLVFAAEDEAARISVTPEGKLASARTVTQDSPDLPELVGRQLSDRDPDPVFREAMVAARTLAQGVRG